MGVNLILYPQHPLWDDSRLAGDKEFAHMIGDELPVITNVPKNATIDWFYENGEPYYRPADFGVWRSVLARRRWPNPGRFQLLTDILEQNPETWLHTSW